jgi:hypothetical protein
MNKIFLGIAAAALFTAGAAQAGIMTLTDAQLDTATFNSGTQVSSTTEITFVNPGIQLVANWSESSPGSGTGCVNVGDCLANWRIDLTGGSEITLGAGDGFGLTFENNNGTWWELGFTLYDSGMVSLGSVSAEVAATDPNTSKSIVFDGPASISYVDIFISNLASSSTDDFSGDFKVRGVPAPFTLALMGLGLLGLAGMRRFKSKV